MVLFGIFWGDFFKTVKGVYPKNSIGTIQDGKMYIAFRANGNQWEETNEWHHEMGVGRVNINMLDGLNKLGNNCMLSDY